MRSRKWRSSRGGSQKPKKNEKAAASFAKYVRRATSSKTVGTPVGVLPAWEHPHPLKVEKGGAFGKCNLHF